MGCLVMLAVLLVVLLVVASPLGLIWSLNVLFGLSIGFTFKTWLAAFLLLFLITDKSVATKSE